MPYRNKQTGEEISDQEYQSMFGQDMLAEPSRVFSGAQEPQRGGFLQRLKLSFGGPQAREQIRQIEEEQGTRGSPDFGDIADVAGAALPMAGAVVGSIYGGATGAGLGAGAGRAVQRFIGKAIGVDEEKPSRILGQAAVEGITTGLLTKGFSVVGKYAASRFPKVLGLFTGETEVVAAALKNPKMADLGLQQGDDAIRNAVQVAGERSIQLRNGFIKGHSQAINQVFRGMKVTPGYGKATRDEVVNKFYGYLRSNRVKYAGGQLDFTTSAIKANPGEISKIQAASDAILNWKNWSQRGVHDLKQMIGQLTKFPTEAGGTSKSPFLGRFYHYLNQKVVEGLPTNRQDLYRAANKKFVENIDLFDDLVDAFNSGDPFTRISQVFGKNKDSLRMLLNFYEQKTGIDIPAIQAGREIGMERSAAFGFLNPREWIDVFISPRVQGRVVTRAGKLQRAADLQIIRRLRTGISGGVAENVSRLFGRREAE